MGAPKLPPQPLGLPIETSPLEYVQRIERDLLPNSFALAFGRSFLSRSFASPESNSPPAYASIDSCSSSAGPSATRRSLW